MFGGLEGEGEGEGRGGEGRGKNFGAKIVKKLVNFAGAAPLPCEENQNFNPRGGYADYCSKYFCKKKFPGGQKNIRARCPKFCPNILVNFI